MIENIKEGLKLTHKNWQLLPIQIAVMVIIFIGFILFVGIPLAIAFVFFGIDLTHAKDFLNVLKNPLEFLSRYFGLTIFIILTFFIYLCFASVLSIFGFSGTLGVLRNSALNTQYKFSFPSFIKESKSLFFPIFWFGSIVLLIFMLVSFIVGIVAGIGFSVVSAYEQGTVLVLFMAYFLALLLILSAVAVTILVLTVSAYAVTIISVDKTKTIEAFRKSYDFVKTKPNAILFYLILIGSYMIINFILFFLNYPFTLIPVIGVFIYIPYQLVTYVFLNYLVLAISSSLIIFYTKSMGYQAESGAYEI
ncbi:MAG: hypothetical protein HZA10_11270 [Nitrospirae bacterium]|nr:hypothetical protein [Nitrospirota bacterium]